MAAIAFAMVLVALPTAAAASSPPLNASGPFSNSCSTAAQKPFEDGVLALHNFEYAEAADLFVDARKADPHCAIAAWGEAMTYWHPLWNAPDAKALASGRSAARSALEQADHATPREQAYIAAIAAFYRVPVTGLAAVSCGAGQGAEQGSAVAASAGKAADPAPSCTKPDASRYGKGDPDAYTSAMQSLHQRFPEDTQGTLFYALGLISTEHGSHDEQLAQARQAAALIAAVFAAEPSNPGAAHYLIHADDRPELASGALAAARVYAKLAPDAPHALHMPSHIFVQLGLWKEDVASNLASYQAASGSAGHADEKVSERLHSLAFLQYAYLQEGDFTRAAESTRTVQQIVQEHAPARQDARYLVPWRLPQEEQDWAAAEKVTPPDDKADLLYSAMYDWLQVIAAAHLHDAARASTCLAKIKLTDIAIRANDTFNDKGRMDVLVPEAEAWADFAKGDNAAAVTAMQQAVAAEGRPESYPDFRVPAGEMLGDLLLLTGDKPGAAAAFESSQATHPGRRLSVAGLHQAQDR